LSGTLLVLVSLPLGLRAPLLNAFVLPVLLLSRILLPMTLAPGWLQTVSDVNPLKHVVEGTREFFLGGYETAVAWWGAALTVSLPRSGGSSACGASAANTAERGLTSAGVSGTADTPSGDTPEPDRRRRHQVVTWRA
jgi:hypothetical protein